MLKILLGLLFTVSAHAQFSNTQEAFIDPLNQIENPKFRSGRAKWTNSAGTFTVSGSGQNTKATFDAGATGQTLCSAARAIPDFLKGKNGAAYFDIAVPSGTGAYLLKVNDGTNDLNSIPMTSTESATVQEVTFIWPSSGNLRACIESTQDEPALDIYGVYLGVNKNVGTAAQAEFVGSIRWATTTNCQWTRTNAAYGDFANDNDCDDNARTVTGKVTDISSGLRPAFGLSDAGPGRYFVVAEGNFTSIGTAVSADVQAFFRLSDGTNVLGGESFVRAGDGASPNPLYVSVPNLSFHFDLSTAPSSSTEFRIQAKTGGTSPRADIGSFNQPFTIYVYRYPLTSTVVRADQTAMSWSGFHAGDCAFARTSTSFGDPTADATCTFTQLTNTNMGSVTSALSGSDKLPGIVFTPKTTGTYRVCSTFIADNSAVGVTVRARLTDGSTVFSSNGHTPGGNNYEGSMTLCGDIVATSTDPLTVKLQTASASSTVTISGIDGVINTANWSIVALNQSLPAPLIKQSVVTSSDGVTGIESALVTDGSATTTVSETTGDWINGVCTNPGAGAYVCTLNAGIFSAPPNCYANAGNVGSSQVWCGANTISATQININCRTSSTGTDTDSARFTLMCIGPR